MSASDGFFLLSAIYLSHELDRGWRIVVGLLCVCAGMVLVLNGLIK